MWIITIHVYTQASHLLSVIIRAHNVYHSRLALKMTPQGLLTGVGPAQKPAFSSREALEECG